MPRRRSTSIKAERDFRNRLNELGATLLDDYLGSMQPHRVICAAGHECRPKPAKIQAGDGICYPCGQARRGAGRSHRAWAAFRAAVEAKGGSVVESEWLGKGVPHRVICSAGHQCRPSPTNVQRGQGFCAECAHSGYKFNEPAIVYLVTSPALAAHKIGVGGLAGIRLKKWQNRGWQVFETLVFDLGVDAFRVERETLRWLRDDLGLGPFLDQAQCPDGFTETIDGGAIDLPTVWAHIVTASQVR